MTSATEESQKAGAYPAGTMDNTSGLQEANTRGARCPGFKWVIFTGSGMLMPPLDVTEMASRRLGEAVREVWARNFMRKRTDGRGAGRRLVI